MLQIESFYENSLAMWHDYLHRGSSIIGVDTESNLLKIADETGVHVRFGVGQSPSFLHTVVTEFGPFDVILDAGNHTSSHMVDSFRYLFGAALTDGGIYIVEGIECDYRTAYRDSRISFIDLVKALIDAMHVHYQVTDRETNLQVGHHDHLGDVTVPAITPILGKIEIYDSLVVLHRANRDLTQSFDRF